jgi:hypothetical protein
VFPSVLLSSVVEDFLSSVPGAFMNSCANQLAKRIQKLLVGLFSTALTLSVFISPALAQETPPPTTLTYPKGWTKCADEGGPCWFLGDVRDVAFGGNGNFVYLLAVQDSVACNRDEFWDNDPSKGNKKSCWYSNFRSRMRTGTVCAAEGQTCTVTGNGTIWFGGGGQFYSKQITAPANQQTSVFCHRNVFGDPHQKVGKYCIFTR